MERKKIMIFSKYGSIDNASRSKTVNYIMETGNNSGIWVLTLKIHGANYSMWCDADGNVKCGKRSGFIEGSSFMGNFNFDYDQNIRDMYAFIKENMSTMETLTICGEIYGGMYLHPDVPRAKSATRVQKEVQYRPDNDFIVFDIKVDGIILDHDMVIDLCADFGFRHVPVMATGKFTDLMKFPVRFPDPLHSYFGLPEIEDNFAEGWVLKPVEPKFFPTGERIILKGKNSEFCEKNGGKYGKPPKHIYELSEEGNRLKDELMSFLNDNRLRNVLSHGDIEEVTQKDFGRLLGLLSMDAFGDFCKDNGTEYEALSKKERTILKKCMNREAGNVIRPNFVNIIDKTF